MTILDPVKLLFDLANDEAKILQRKQGRSEKGIVSTQVQGLIIALGKHLEYFDKINRRGKVTAGK